MPKVLTGAEIVFKCLEDQDVEYIFGYPGGAVLPKDLSKIGLKTPNHFLLKTIFLKSISIIPDKI